MKPFLEDVKKSLATIKEGGIILYPTDTVWGIGCDATSVEAVNKIFSIKKRTSSKSMILLIDHESKLASYVREIPEQAWALIEYSEKPLTIIYDGAKNLPSEVIAEDGSVAIRVTKDEFCCNLISSMRKPLISTSANLSGDATPSSFNQINQAIIESVNYVVKWRQEENIVAQPSKIIRLKSGGQIQFIR